MLCAPARSPVLSLHPFKHFFLPAFTFFTLIKVYSERGSAFFFSGQSLNGFTVVQVMLFKQLPALGELAEATGYLSCMPGFVTSTDELCNSLPDLFLSPLSTLCDGSKSSSFSCGTWWEQMKLSCPRQLLWHFKAPKGCEQLKPHSCCTAFIGCKSLLAMFLLSVWIKFSSGLNYRSVLQKLAFILLIVCRGNPLQ